jgi:hypothetical protein
MSGKRKQVNPPKRRDLQGLALAPHDGESAPLLELTWTCRDATRGSRKTRVDTSRTLIIIVKLFKIIETIRSRFAVPPDRTRDERGTRMLAFPLAPTASTIA